MDINELEILEHIDYALVPTPDVYPNTDIHTSNSKTMFDTNANKGNRND